MHFSPKQSGTGDPSPSNVRAIDGWTGLDVHRNGKNLFDFFATGYYSPSRQSWTGDNKAISSKPVRMKAGTVVTLSSPYAGTGYSFEEWKIEVGSTSDCISENLITRASNSTGLISRTYTVQNDCFLMARTDTTNANMTVDSAQIQLELGSSATSYEAYNGTSYPISWQSTGTVYGGYVDLISGEVWRTYSKLHFISSYFIDIIETTNNTYAAASAQIANIATTNNVVISDKFKGISNNNPTESGLYEACVTSERRLYIGLPSELSSLSLVKSWIDDIDGFDVAYKLATPQLATTLTPETINALIGTNTFWSNADSVEIEYESQYVDDVIESYRRRILMSLPHPETTSGTIANFKTDMHAKLKECKVEFSPYQDGTGDPSPSNVRPIRGWTGVDAYHTGKNIGHVFGYSATTVNSTTATRPSTNNYGTTISTTDYSAPDTSVTITQSQATETSNIPHYKNGYFCIGVDSLTFGERYDFSFKVTNITSNPLNASLSDIKIIMPYGNSVGPTNIIDDCLIFQNVQFKQLESAPTRQTIDIRNCGMSFTLSEFMVTPANKSDGVFEPYSCTTYPIEFPLVGKNKWTFGNYTETKNDVLFEANGSSLHVSGTNSGGSTQPTVWNTHYITLPAGTYTISCNEICSNLPSAHGVFINFRLNNTTEINPTIYNKTFTLEETTDIYGYVGVYGTSNQYHKSNIDVTINIQIESGSATTYEPYGRTVFGGYVDLTRGKVVAEWEYGDMGDLTWDSASSASSTYERKKRWEDAYGGNSTTLPSLLCDQALVMTLGGFNNSIGVTGQFATVNSSGKFYFMSPDISGYNANQVADYLTDKKYAIKLSEPVEYDITPEIIKTIKGTNNIWSSTNENVDVKYWKH